ncbi:MAG: hypothetical protein JKX70_09445 [Phycisphaerales bacterium]|nr:hypothetical protein [Phycisphaerales bacterium]
MNTPEEIRTDIQSRLGDIVLEVNKALNGGKSLNALEPTLKRLGKGEQIPHWYSTLHKNGYLPNLDGKSLGSVIEMVLVAVLEKKFYSQSSVVPFRINPAKGVDIPAIKLGVKSPSTNYCTSEPFFSAYERLLGNEHDAVILLTNYQETKNNPPLRIQIIDHKYLFGSQISDQGLCRTARKCRESFAEDDVSELKKVVRFLVHANQQDREAKAILSVLSDDLDDSVIDTNIDQIVDKLDKSNKKKIREGKEPYSTDFIERLNKIKDSTPRWLAVVNAADNWVIENHKDFGRYPNDNEWERFLRSNLDGMIGMSFALQWRYNFGHVFSKKK